MKFVRILKQKLSKIYMPILIFYLLAAICVILSIVNILILFNYLDIFQKKEQPKDFIPVYEDVASADSNSKDTMQNLTVVSDNLEENLINTYIRNVCDSYPNVDEYLIRSMVQQESSYNPNAKNGEYLGLMQVSTRWHSDRMKKLNVSDLFDPYGNILVGVDYVSELLEKYEDTELVLMLYSMPHDDAILMYKSGKISTYALEVLERANEMRTNGE